MPSTLLHLDILHLLVEHLNSSSLLVLFSVSKQLAVLLRQCFVWEELTFSRQSLLLAPFVSSLVLRLQPCCVNITPMVRAGVDVLAELLWDNGPSHICFPGQQALSVKKVDQLLKCILAHSPSRLSCLRHLDLRGCPGSSIETIAALKQTLRPLGVFLDLALCQNCESDGSPQDDVPWREIVLPWPPPRCVEVESSCYMRQCHSCQCTVCCRCARSLDLPACSQCRHWFCSDCVQSLACQCRSELSYSCPACPSLTCVSCGAGGCGLCTHRCSLCDVTRCFKCTEAPPQQCDDCLSTFCGGCWGDRPAGCADCGRVCCQSAVPSANACKPLCGSLRSCGECGDAFCCACRTLYTCDCCTYEACSRCRSTVSCTQCSYSACDNCNAVYSMCYICGDYKCPSCATSALHACGACQHCCECPAQNPASSSHWDLRLLQRRHRHRRRRHRQQRLREATAPRFTFELGQFSLGLYGFPQYPAAAPAAGPRRVSTCSVSKSLSSAASRATAAVSKATMKGATPLQPSSYWVLWPQHDTASFSLCYLPRYDPAPRPELWGAQCGWLAYTTWSSASWVSGPGAHAGAAGVWRLAAVCLTLA